MAYQMVGAKRQRTGLMSHAGNLANVAWGYIRRNPGVAARVIQNAYRNYQSIRPAGGSQRSYAQRTARRRGDRPGGRGFVTGTRLTGSGFKRKLGQVSGFRGVPAINETYLDTHTAVSMTMRAYVDPNNQNAVAGTSYHHFVVPIEVSDIEPFKLAGFTVNDLLTQTVLRQPRDPEVRGYPCNQLLHFYNNYVIKGAEIKCDVRLVEREPGGAAAAATTAGWNQTGRVTVPVNFALLRFTPEEMLYMTDSLPFILKGNLNNNTPFNANQLAAFDRVMREQFGAKPLTLDSHRGVGTVGTNFSTTVANSTDAATIMEGIDRHYLDSSGALVTPDNDYLGVTGNFETNIVRRPYNKQYVMLVGWFNPTALEEYFLGRPNNRDVTITMDFHIRQQVAFGDGISINAGISSGENIVSRSGPSTFVSERIPAVPTLPAYRPGAVALPWNAVPREGEEKEEDPPVPTAAPKLKRSKKSVIIPPVEEVKEEAMEVI